MVKRKFITKYTSLSGVISSKKNLTHVWFESALEKDFALLLEYHPTVNRYTEQPVTIEYMVNDKVRVYTPDFLVHFKDPDQKPWLCEIKYRDDFSMNFKKYKAKFKAAVQFCKEQGWEFKLISENNIRTPLLENLKFLNRYEKEYVDQNCYDLILNRVNDLGSTTPREVLVSISDANPSIHAKCVYALWYALRISKVGCDYSKPLTLETELWKQ
ncbi:TnsA endonuclease N-terminal domain-containing protein [Fluviicola taffensis]|uniref:TnsA endonuclease N-terminal domain-containing protein n=1 Tax=Fluviicola taffensis TaxID=191579 RepID=UPI003137E148